MQFMVKECCSENFFLCLKGGLTSDLPFCEFGDVTVLKSPEFRVPIDFGWVLDYRLYPWAGWDLAMTVGGPKVLADVFRFLLWFLTNDSR